MCYPRVEVPETQVSGDEKDALGSMFGGHEETGSSDDTASQVWAESEMINAGFSGIESDDHEDDFIADDDGEQWMQ